MPSRQTSVVVPWVLSSTILATSVVAVAATIATGFHDSGLLQGLGIAAATIAALLWACTLAISGRAVSTRSGSPTGTNHIDAVALRRGLPTPSYLALISLSALAAGTIFAATRSTGIAALLWGLATIGLGSMIGGLRLYGYRQRFEDRSLTPDEVPSVGAKAGLDPDGIDDWLRVSRNATTVAMLRLQKTQLSLFTFAAVLTQIVVGTGGVVTGLAIGMVAIGTFVKVTASRVITRRLANTAIAITSLGLIMLNLNTIETWAPLPTATVLAWTCVMCTAAAFAASPGRAIYASAAIAGSALFALIVLWSWQWIGAGSGSANAQTNFNWILIPAAALCFAHVTTTLSTTLRSLSRTFDDVAERSWLRLNDAIERSAHDAAVFETSRLVHDTLINTLGAVRARQIEPVRLQRRLVDDLERLDADEIPGPPGRGAELLPLADAVGRALTRAKVLGVDVDCTHPDPPESTHLPRDQVDAVYGSLVEALTNVSKHSTDKIAWVSLHAVEDGGTQVDITSSRPADLAIDQSRDGMSKSIVERCARAGLAAHITVDAHRIRVRLVIPSDVNAGVGDSVDDATASSETVFDATAYIRNASLAATRSVSFWPIGYCILLSAAWVSHYGIGWWLVGAVLATATALTAINVRAAELTVWGLLPTTAATSALVLVWQINGPTEFSDLGPLGPLGLSYIGAAVIVVTFLFTDSSGPKAGGVVVGYIGGCIGVAYLFTTEGNSPWLPVVAAVAMAGFAVPLALASSWLRTGANQASELARGMSERETRQRRFDSDRRAREQVIALAIGGYRSFIDDLAQGRRDLADPAVLDEASRVERALRTYVQVGSTPGPITDDLLALISLAQESGVVVDVFAYDSSSADNLADVDAVTRAGRSLIAAGSPGDVLAISTYRERDEFGVTFVIDRLVTRPPALGDESGSTIDWVAAADQTFVDLRLTNRLTT